MPAGRWRLPKGCQYVLLRIFPRDEVCYPSHPMDDDGVNLICFCLYKVSCITAGVALCVMGYKLFMEKITEVPATGTIDLKYFVITLKTAGPGIFFAAFGVIALIGTIHAGYQTHYKKPPSAGTALISPSLTTASSSPSVTPKP